MDRGSRAVAIIPALDIPSKERSCSSFVLFFFAGLSSCINFMPIWRFSAFAFQFEGGNMIWPSFVTAFVFTCPVMYLETLVGRYIPICVPLPVAIREICPLATGLAISMAILNLALLMYNVFLVSKVLSYGIGALRFRDNFFRCTTQQFEHCHSIYNDEDCNGIWVGSSPEATQRAFGKMIFHNFRCMSIQEFCTSNENICHGVTDYEGLTCQKLHYGYDPDTQKCINMSAPEDSPLRLVDPLHAVEFFSPTEDIFLSEKNLASDVGLQDAPLTEHCVYMIICWVFLGFLCYRNFIGHTKGIYLSVLLPSSIFLGFSIYLIFDPSSKIVTSAYFTFVPNSKIHNSDLYVQLIFQSLLGTGLGTGRFLKLPGATETCPNPVLASITITLATQIFWIFTCFLTFGTASSLAGINNRYFYNTGPLLMHEVPLITIFAFLCHIPIRMISLALALLAAGVLSLSYMMFLMDNLVSTLITYFPRLKLSTWLAYVMVAATGISFSLPLVTPVGFKRIAEIDVFCGLGTLLICFLEVVILLRLVDQRNTMLGEEFPNRYGIRWVFVLVLPLIFFVSLCFCFIQILSSDADSRLILLTIFIMLAPVLISTATFVFRTLRSGGTPEDLIKPGKYLMLKAEDNVASPE